MSNIELIPMPTNNPDVSSYRGVLRGYPIPHVKITMWPQHEGRQVYKGSDPTWKLGGSGPTLPEDFVPTWAWTVEVDHRLAWDFSSREEVCHVLSLVADAMAVAAGFTSHGCSNRNNPHGPVEEAYKAPALV